MTVDEILEDVDEPAPTDNAVVPPRASARKTKQQRTRILKQKAEVNHFVQNLLFGTTHDALLKETSIG